MSQNKEDLKNKIIYRASYRGTKEMDILMTSFVKSSIDGLNMNELKQLSKLVNLEDELLYPLETMPGFSPLSFRRLASHITKGVLPFPPTLKLPTTITF